MKGQLRYTKRGWLSKEEFKCEGEISRFHGKKDVELLYKIHGNWNSKIYVTPYVNGKPDYENKELVFDKPEYPEKWEYMYGFSHFSIQMNYFPKRLENQIAPTDTRRRPDQRALESGDFDLASKEKERLEVKQRKVRKWMEKNEAEHLPKYFIEEYNKEDDQNYWIYNH